MTHDTPEAVEAMVEEMHFTVSDLPTEISCWAAAAMLRRLHQRAVDAERERDGANALAERMHSQDVLAIKAWHKAHPRNDLTWPDHMRLTAWCMGSVAQLVAERDAYRGNCTDALAENDALRFERNNLRAALATSRADALREAVNIADAVSQRASHNRMRAVEDCHTSEIHHQEGRWHAANDIGEDIAILAAKPTTTTGET